MASLGSLICVLFFLITTTVAEICFSEIRSDSCSTIPLDEFGFTHTSSLELTVTQISFDDQTLKNPILHDRSLDHSGSAHQNLATNLSPLLQYLLHVCLLCIWCVIAVCAVRR
ncbi:hypothetical protein CsSME_00050397 [Camellia sinensis var. sinensis]